MAALAFPEFLHRHPRILGEGAIIERLRRDPATPLDPHLINSAFIYDRSKRRVLEGLYRQYLQIGADHGLPLLLQTPTWRATTERIRAAGLADCDVNADNVHLLQHLRREFGAYGDRVAIGGLIGCRGDAYRPAEGLETAAATEFHRGQAERLAAAGVDFLLGITLPALPEATGLAAALAATGLPYVLSFVVRPAGTLLDGTPLASALSTLDTTLSPRPTAYFINCTHPDLARAALFHPTHSSPQVRQRILGLLGNTAALSPEALDGQAHLIAAEPAAFASAMADLGRDAGLPILGGCCGTDDRHIRALAQRWRS